MDRVKAAPAWFQAWFHDFNEQQNARFDQINGRIDNLNGRVDDLKSGQREIHKTCAKAFNRSVDDGTTTNYVPVPFNDGKMPTETGLPALETKGDVDALSRPDLRKYVTGYGGARIRGEDAQRQFVLTAIGAMVETP